MIDHRSCTPKRPIGRTNSTAHQDDEGDRRAPFRADELHRARFGEPDDEAAEHGARHAADAAEDGGREHRQQQVEAHQRPDLHQDADHDAGDAGERRRRAAR